MQGYRVGPNHCIMGESFPLCASLRFSCQTAVIGLVFEPGGVVKFTVIPVKTGIHIRLERDSFLNLATCGFRPVSEYGVTVFRRNDRIGRWLNVFPILTTPSNANG